MKDKPNLPKFLWPWFMSLLLSWGAAACLATAFPLDIPSMGSLFWYSLVVSGVFALGFTYRFRWWKLPVLAGIGLLLLIKFAQSRNVTLMDSLESMLYQISLIFDNTYSWGVIRWSELPPGAMPLPALLLVIQLMAFTVSVTVCRRTHTTFAVLLALTPLLLCMVARDTVPDTWCLWLLLVGLGLLLLTGGSWHMDEKAGQRLTAMVLIPTILATSLLFWILPPSGYKAGGLSDGIVSWIQSLTFWAKGSVGGESFTGDSAMAQVDLSRLGIRVDNQTLAMTVVAGHTGRLYLRGRGYDTYNGKLWTATTDSTGKDPGWSSPDTGELHTLTVTMESPRMLLYFPGNSSVDLREMNFTKGYLPNRNNQLEYSFNYGTPREYATGSLNDPGWVALPEETRVGIQKHLDAALQGVDTADTAAVVRAIELYVETSAIYGNRPGMMPDSETDFALWFLDDSEMGYCVHFATAATVLLRAAGIPARYVTGYVLDVKAGKTTKVWEHQAHAWVEYFKPNAGWTILEATPGYSGSDPVATEPPETTAPPATTAPPETTAPTDPADTSPAATQGTRPNIDTTENSQAGTLEATLPAGQVSDGAMPDWVKTAIFWLLAVAAALIALWGQYRLRIWARRRYLRRGNANRQALNRYRLIALRSRLVKQNIPSHITELAEKAKFSRHTITKEELRLLDAHLEALGVELTGESRILRFLFAIK